MLLVHVEGTPIITVDSAAHEQGVFTYSIPTAPDLKLVKIIGTQMCQSYHDQPPTKIPVTIIVPVYRILSITEQK